MLRTRSRRAAGTAGTVLDDALTVACGEGAVRVLEVQRSGKRPMAAGEFLRGFPLQPGARACRGPIKHRPNSADEAAPAAAVNSPIKVCLVYEWSSDMRTLAFGLIAAAGVAAGSLPASASITTAQHRAATTRIEPRALLRRNRHDRGGRARVPAAAAA